ncbi:TetR/AcrR family transcriptional regulator [Ktedonospora formicarum]|uniref:TetR family transcriptional regulator n=1 Tax=Ktedonospora formicarum TaxID=2778364 RepID=A0A8J3MVJ0_9CHLR|nr:TetR/AcrR family transcriptional regulator [Ktedonospora formicarum]GHO46565.1 TetR family transcriptional regulator [Ktedonospora formicarum]
MQEEPDGKRTRKGEHARQRILESALSLFGSRGYEETTMREIAAAAGYSPGLTYRYFASKEELVLGLYKNLCTDLEFFTHSLPICPLPERFHMMVTKQMELMTPYREALSALFGSALNTRSSVGVFSKNTEAIRFRGRETYLIVIQEAKDAPKEPQCEDLATILYGTHLALVLFWLIDESRGAWRSRLLLAFLRDMLKLMQPLLWLPPIVQALARLAAILGPLLGDKRQTALFSQPSDEGDPQL